MKVDNSLVFVNGNYLLGSRVFFFRNIYAFIELQTTTRLRSNPLNTMFNKKSDRRLKRH